MKNSKLLTLLPLLGFMALTACNGSAKPSESSSSEPGTEESTGDSSTSEKKDYLIENDVTIKFNHTFSYTEILDSFAAEFKKIEPHVTVEYNKVGGGYDGLRTQNISDFSTGEYPDLTICYPDHVVDYMDYNKVVQLDAYMDNEEYGWSTVEKNDVVKAFMEEGQAYPVEGTYSLPFAKSAEAMYYNKTVLIGMDLHTVDATINGGKPLTEDYINSLTWEELFGKLCPALQAYNDSLPENSKFLKTDQKYHGIVGYDADDNLFITLAMQYEYGYTAINQKTGVGQILWNNDNMKGLMKTFSKAYDDGYFLTKASIEGNYVNTIFTKQNVLFSIGSTGGIKYQYDASNDWEVGVAKIPQAEGHDDQIISQGPGICMLSHGNDAAGNERKLASWLFYKFITNTLNAVKWAIATGYTPIRESSFETEAYTEYFVEAGPLDLETLTAKNATYSMNTLDCLFINPAFRGSSTSRSQCGALLTNCLMQKDITDEYINEQFELAYNNVLIAMGDQ